MQRRMTTLRGFTLVEMMIAITLMAVLLAMAVPSFRDASLGSTVRSLANELVVSAALARSEAIKRNAPVTLCVSSNGTSCGTGGWEQGWIVARGATVIQRQAAAPTGFKITPTGGVTTLSFRPFGAGVASAVFTVCRATPTVGRQERVVTIDATGRGWVRRTTDEACS
jgi:type IV fimbrial biogenesis protein FimT